MTLDRSPDQLAPSRERHSKFKTQNSKLLTVIIKTAVSSTPQPGQNQATSAFNAPSLHSFFGPGGLLSQTHPAYEFRRGQLDMARAVEQALEENRHLIVEAGTGTG